MKWIKRDGYHEMHQYVDGSGMILAEVRGSRFEPEDGWIALDKTQQSSVWLGVYADLEAAKLAAERHHSAS